jgi:hypothetical protein
MTMQGDDREALFAFLLDFEGRQGPGTALSPPPTLTETIQAKRVACFLKDLAGCKVKRAECLGEFLGAQPDVEVWLRSYASAAGKARLCALLSIEQSPRIIGRILQS